MTSTNRVAAARRSRRTAVVAGCAAAAVGLAGCGAFGGGSAASPPGPSEPAPSVPTAGPGSSSPGTGGGTGGTGGGTPSPVPTGTPSRPPAGPDRCHTADLALSLRMSDSGAGQRYLSVVLTNRSRRTCRVYGYGGLQLVDATGRPVPTRQDRAASPPARLAVLTPGASAYSTLHWTVVPSPTEPQSGNCEPVASSLRVIPPDETTALTAPWRYGPVCFQGRIDQRAYQPGTGQP